MAHANRRSQNGGVDLLSELPNYHSHPCRHKHYIPSGVPDYSQRRKPSPRCTSSRVEPTFSRAASTATELRSPNLERAEKFACSGAGPGGVGGQGWLCPHAREGRERPAVAAVPLTRSWSSHTAGPEGRHRSPAQLAVRAELGAGNQRHSVAMEMRQLAAGAGGAAACRGGRSARAGAGQAGRIAEGRGGGGTRPGSVGGRETRVAGRDEPPAGPRGKPEEAVQVQEAAEGTGRAEPGAGLRGGTGEGQGRSKPGESQRGRGEKPGFGRAQLFGRAEHWVYKISDTRPHLHPLL